MASLDPVVLARVQFGFTMAFHIVSPAFTIGLASYLATLEALWLGTGRAVFYTLYKYWLKIFTLSFAAGIVSGVVMSYEFGMNWSVFSRRAGPIVGPLMTYEVLTAFFLEAGFLGIMLYGVERVGKRLHLFATIAVAVGTLLSTFWILAANSWMQTPAGFVIDAQGQFKPTDWMKVIFNPSFPYRLVHMSLAAFLTTAFFVGGVGAYHLLRDNRQPAARVMFLMAVAMAALVTPLQILAGDMHGLNTLARQPAKIMAMEGHFQSYPTGAPLILFGLPDQNQARVRDAIEIPHGGSLILKHDPNAPLAGLDTIPRENWPPVAIVFWSFRIMVGLGGLMLALGVLGVIALARGRLFEWQWLHRFAVLLTPAGFIAVIAGWITTEVGRQPYSVYGFMRTAESVSPIASPALVSSLIAFFVVYAAIFGLGAYYMAKLLHTPASVDESDPPATRAAGITPAPAFIARKPRGDAS